MGYTTDFYGEFTLDPPLTDEQALYINRFAATRRMARNAKKTEKLKDPVRKAVGLPIGLDGGYFVGGDGSYGQNKDDSIVEYNEPPCGQPGLWCQWVTQSVGVHDKLYWDGDEKFYRYEHWLKYLIKHFFEPWGVEVSGFVDFQGENSWDAGQLHVIDGVVKIAERLEKYTVPMTVED